MAKLREFAEYRQIAGIDEIGRRYLAMNAFDGILTMIGVLMGSYVAGIREPRIVISTGLATCLAMGVSGFWGAYLTESAERKHEMQELEHAMLSDMSHSKQARASRFAAVVVSIIDGLSPLVAGMIVLLPFILCNVWHDVMASYGLSVGIALALLFGLGVFLARVAHEHIIPAGVRMIVAGVVCVILSFFLAGGH